MSATEQRGCQADSIETGLRSPDPSQIEQGREDVEGDRGRVGGGAGLDAVGPPCDGGHPVAALPNHGLGSPKRSVVTLRCCTIVGEEEDERVLLQFEFLERVDHFTDARIHLLHHFPVSLFNMPRRMSLLHNFVGDAKGFVVGTLVGVVRSLMCNIEAERAVFVFVDELLGIVRDQMRAVAGLVGEFSTVPPIQHAHPIVVGMEIDIAADVSVKFIKSLIYGIVGPGVAEMPFAHHAGPVSGSAKVFGEGDFLGLKSVVAVLFWIGEHDFGHAGTLLISSGEQRGTGGGTHRAVGMKIGKAQSLLRQLIDSRRLVAIIAITTRVGVTHVVGHDDHEVRPGRGDCEGERQQENGEYRESCFHVYRHETIWCFSGGIKTKSSANEITDMPVNDEHFYETVSQEMKLGNVQEGMWMKAFEQAMGDEKKATAIYIKMRVDQLKREDAKAQMAVMGVDAEDEDLEDDGAVMAVKRIEDRIPPGLLNALQVGGFIIGCILIWVFRQELMGLGRSFRAMLQGG